MTATPATRAHLTRQLRTGLFLSPLACDIPTGATLDTTYFVLGKTMSFGTYTRNHRQWQLRHQTHEDAGPPPFVDARRSQGVRPRLAGR